MELRFSYSCAKPLSGVPLLGYVHSADTIVWDRATRSGRPQPNGS